MLTVRLLCSIFLALVGEVNPQAFVTLESTTPTARNVAPPASKVGK